MSRPLLFYGDSPDLHTGLARIGRDLACLACRLPQYRIGYLGRGGIGSRQLPFMQYNFPETDQWGESHLARVWADFSGGDRGVILTVWDASRLTWFARPNYGLSQQLPDLAKMLLDPPFERWGYMPVDSTGVGGRLTEQVRLAAREYDRVLAYGAWGAEVLRESVGRVVDWAPHGITMNTWQPRDRVGARLAAGWGSQDTVVGVVMTNQTRKDWGVAAAVASEMKHVKWWWHTDQLARSFRWDIRELVNDFGISDRVRVTVGDWMSDLEMSYWYSACDATILPSLGEGFGYPIVESLACGVPVVHGTYGGGAELVPDRDWLVEPAQWRLEGLQGCVRPVYRPEDWVAALQRVLDGRVQAEYCRQSVEHLDWKNLWPSVWEKWFVGGSDE